MKASGFVLGPFKREPGQFVLVSVHKLGELMRIAIAFRVELSPDGLEFSAHVVRVSVECGGVARNGVGERWSMRARTTGCAGTAGAAAVSWLVAVAEDGRIGGEVSVLAVLAGIGACASHACGVLRGRPGTP